MMVWSIRVQRSIEHQYSKAVTELGQLSMRCNLPVVKMWPVDQSSESRISNKLA
jgi:hypothetical protein